MKKVKTIWVNGERMEFSGCYLQELLASQSQQHYACALNHCFVSRSEYATTKIVDGDHIEILIPMAGG